MESLRARLRFAARAGLLLALLALGVTLVVSAARSYRATEDISSLLDRAQAERFFRAVPELHERNRGPATAADLAKLLAQYEGEGLRYLAEYDQQGNVLAEAGQFLGSERPRPDRSRSPRVVGERVRATFRAPRPGRGPAKPGRPEPRPPFEDDEEGRPFGGPGPSPNLPDLVLELEPTVSNQLRDRASRSFAFSTAAAVALCVLTIALWLSLRREERRRERTERERHLAVLGEMSAVLAHEIRNPLASLKGNAQLLAEQLDAASPLQKKVVRVLGEAKRLEDLTTTLLDLVRSSSVARAPTDPARLLRDAADAIAPERIDVLVDDAPASFPLDALRMDQVLQNLIRNAIQASSPEGRVEVSATVQRGALVVRVRDHGPGLPEKDADRLFEAFHTTRTRGTGLGLAIARRIVELHGGTLTAENHVDGGALFTAQIPAKS